MLRERGRHHSLKDVCEVTTKALLALDSANFGSTHLRSSLGGHQGCNPRGEQFQALWQGAEPVGFASWKRKIVRSVLGAFRRSRRKRPRSR